MIKLLGYQVLAQIYESANSQVYRAIREVDTQPVILKVLKEDYPTQAELTRYKQEYELTHTLNLEGVIKAYGLEKYKNTLVIILEDFGGESLSFWKRTYQFNLETCLSIALKTTISLGAIHAAHIIHKDINPSNIVYHRETQKLKIIDFGISTRLTRENPTLKNPNVLEGTLAYISPEQTGRMNRSLDYRTDFYSLGVTFYELLTGKLPFETEDDLELVHCHLAKKPLCPSVLNPLIPPILSDLVMKLMAKNAEDRYQSCWGLKADLETCLNQLKLTEKIDYFPLARQDISDKFQIPQKLYGRDQEIETLITTFERVSNPPQPSPTQTEKQSQSEMMLIAGYSGIGKSVLVQEIYKPITEKRGYFISGKFDQFQRNIPYSAMVSALQKLMQHFLSGSDTQLHFWKTKILNALGGKGQVIIDVIPELQLIIGEQPPVPELGLNESQNRFNLVFQSFIRACCNKDHPLVIFLDDLQWADRATLKLIKLMMTDINLNYLFLIGAYRDNDVSPGHPLTIMVDELKKSQAIITTITLNNLRIEDIIHLIADTLKTNIQSVTDLAKLVFKKTSGNPFFVRQFLLVLYTDSLIVFHYKTRGWDWKLEQIKSKNITDNVVELMISKFKNLPSDLQEIIQLAACIGSSFDLQTLSIIGEKHPDEIFTYLIIAVEAGLILALSELNEQLFIQDYQFLHDRVQQAAYSLIPEDQKQATHLKIGNLLKQNYSEVKQEERLFDIVGHLNLGRELITQQTNRNELAYLNCLAGQKAKASIAYVAALEYLHTGIELLGKESWNNNYDLTLKLYLEATQTSYLQGDFQAMEDLGDIVIQKSQSVLEKTGVYETKLQAYSVLNRFLDGIELGLFCLNLLGVKLPAKPDDLTVKAWAERTQAQLDQFSLEELINLPEMTDPGMLSAMRILSRMTPLSYFGGPNLFNLVTLQGILLSLEYGNAIDTPNSYACYALILCSPGVDQFSLGYEYGQVAIQLLEKQNNKQRRAIVLNNMYAHVPLWREHIRNILPHLQDAYQSGLEFGDLEFAAYALTNRLRLAYAAGEELFHLETEFKTTIAFTRSIQGDATAEYACCGLQTILNLIASETPWNLQGEVYDAQKGVLKFKESQNFLGLSVHYLSQLQLHYWFNYLVEAVEDVLEGQKYIDHIGGIPPLPEFVFFAALTHLKVVETASETQKAYHLEQAEKRHKRLKLWADNAPMNFLHKWQLVEAEKNRVLGDKSKAIELYDRAISSAKEQEYIQEFALANELAAQFYLNWGKEKIARHYMQEALYAYSCWGANAKVKDLEQKYPQLLNLTSLTTQFQEKISTRISTGQNSGNTLDLATIMKANQAISGEIILEKLLGSLMKIIIQSAGAQTGYLILSQQNRLVIEASGMMDSDEITVLQCIPVENCQLLSKTIVNYVARTKQTVVLNDATHKGNFRNDAYIQQYQPKSILCAPLINQGKLVSIVYLENNLTTRTFTPERVEILNLLSSQAAISIENAKLYTEVRDSESRLIQFLDAMPVGVAILDASGRSYYSNQVAKKLLGKGLVNNSTSDEIPDIYQIYQAGRNEKYPATDLPVVRALQGETVRADDLEIHQNDQIIPVEAVGKPVYNEQGEITYAITVFQDITERKQAQKILTDYNEMLKYQVAKRTAELEKANQELLRLANLDGLTQVPNRRRFDEYLAVEWRRHLREQQFLSLILIDIDYFKRYNDHYGHQGGDDCLILVAQTIAQIPQRSTDLVARYGGEEFVVILPHTSPEGALTVGESIRNVIAALAIPHAESEVSEFVSLSIGVATLIPTLEASTEDLIAQADQALYDAKKQGRNRVMVFSEQLQ